VLAAFAVSILLGRLFVRRQLRTRDPLLDVGLFKRPAFLLGSSRSPPRSSPSSG
jgi:hypothetical protein